ncbi:MAG: hypothetical protein ACOYEG_08670 [Petrimonas sp.]
MNNEKGNLTIFAFLKQVFLVIYGTQATTGTQTNSKIITLANASDKAG